MAVAIIGIKLKYAYLNEYVIPSGTMLHHLHKQFQHVMDSILVSMKVME